MLQKESPESFSIFKGGNQSICRRSSEIFIKPSRNDENSLRDKE